MSASHATPEGTRRYAERFPAAVSGGHFREACGLAVSSLGLGTYLGEADDETDRLCVRAGDACLRRGVNFLDTAINYRHQRGERALGRAVAERIAAGDLRRDEIVVCTKGGYLPFDGDVPADPRRFLREAYAGLFDPERDLAAGCHAMTPAYLKDQIARSLRNLGLSCIDVYYVHNPETQLPAVGPEEFYRRLETAFRALEEEAAQGRIAWYGTATWNGYRVGPDAPEHLELERVVKAARAAGGAEHRFRFVQCPVNLAMLEAAGEATQTVRGEATMLFEAAAELGVHLVSSASLLQGRLAGGLPSSLRNRLSDLETDAQRSLQVVRSLPGLTSALVGMKDPAHVEENLELVGRPILDHAQLAEIMS